MKPEHKQLALSYARSVIVAMSTLVVTTNPDWDTFVKALVAALLAPALRWADPSDTAFGRGS